MFLESFYQLSSQSVSVLNASNEMDSTLLITGSTGTGKSHLAYQVHQRSLKRSSKKFTKVNLATLSENLIESELFGHERGAFTGAENKRIGKLETCNGGTVFLDEIGELPLRLQAKLLDFIQYKKISPVGSNKEIELDVRIIVATNRNLEAAVKNGDFRGDLFHRLNVFHINLPSLSLNPKAAILIARNLLKTRAALVQKSIFGFSPEVEKLIRHYSWPGNIRELENMIEFAVAMEVTQEIRLQSLPKMYRDHANYSMHLKLNDQNELVCDQEFSQEVINLQNRVKAQLATKETIGLIELPITMNFHECKDAFERTYLEHVLKVCSGQINLTSRRIGLNKVSLTEKIKKFSIDWRKIRHQSVVSS